MASVGDSLWPVGCARLYDGGWRQRLYLKRLGQPEQWTIPQWLQHGISNMAQQWGWRMMEVQSSLVTARGSEANDTQILTRQLTIAGKSYDLSIFPKAQGIWRFELQSSAVGGLVPGGFKLRLLSEDLLPFENNEDVATTAVERLYLEVQVSPGDGLVLGNRTAARGLRSRNFALRDLLLVVLSSRYICVSLYRWRSDSALRNHGCWFRLLSIVIEICRLDFIRLKAAASAPISSCDFWLNSSSICPILTASAVRAICRIGRMTERFNK